MPERTPTVGVTIEDVMRAEFGPGYIEIECPYEDCAGVARAEPDAQETCCTECDRLFNVDNPI